jgi:hypothetical protein
MDPLEKEALRKKMAFRMGMFLESAPAVSCVSGHFYDELHLCELCDSVHADELLVIKNRAGKKLRVALPCLKEMIRFRVADVDDLSRWITKLGELRTEADRRKEARAVARQDERRLLEKKVIVRKRAPQTGV